MKPRNLWCTTVLVFATALIAPLHAERVYAITLTPSNVERIGSGLEMRAKLIGQRGETAFFDLPLEVMEAKTPPGGQRNGPPSFRRRHGYKYEAEVEAPAELGALMHIVIDVTARPEDFRGWTPSLRVRSGDQRYLAIMRLDEAWLEDRCKVANTQYRYILRYEHTRFFQTGPDHGDPYGPPPAKSTPRQGGISPYPVLTSPRAIQAVEPARLIPNIVDWLDAHPRVRAHVKFPGLTEAELNQRLTETYARLIAGQPLDIQEPPKCRAPRLFPTTYAPLELEEARRIYTAQVAHSVYAETFTPWSLDELTDDGLRVLFSHEYGLLPIHGEAGPDSVRYKSVDENNLTVANPQLAFQFLMGNGLYKSSRWATIEATVDWVRDNLTHYGYENWAGGRKTYQDWFGFPFYPTLTGMVNAGKSSGCHGVTGLLREALRTVNIPVESMFRGHSQTRFVHEDLYMGHGDDPYAVSRRRPGFDRIPTSDLLFPRSLYTDFFDSFHSPGTVGEHQRMLHQKYGVETPTPNTSSP